MITHNYFTLSDTKKAVKSCNSIADNFRSLFLAGENLLKYFYIFYGENSVIKVESEYLSGNIENTPYLKYRCELAESLINNQTITAVGLGGESGYISRAETSFLKTGKMIINAAIFIEIQNFGKILNINFLKMLMGEPLEVKGAVITDKEKQLCDYNYFNLEFFAAEKIYTETLQIKFNSALKKGNVLIAIDNKPSYLFENVFEEYGNNFLSSAANFCIDTNKKIKLDETQYSVVPLYVIQPYGNYIDKGQKISIIKELDSESIFKTASDGKCFTLEKDGKLFCFTYADNKFNSVLLFGDLNLENIACYDVCSLGLATVANDGIIKLYNFYTGAVKTISKGVTSPENIKVSNDFSFISIWGSTTGYYYYASTEVMNTYVMANQLYAFNSGDNTVNRYYSGNIVSYYLNGNTLSYMTLGANLFDESVSLKSIYHFSNYLAKIGEKTILFYSQTNGNMIVFSDDNAVSVKLSPSGKYFLVNYSNGAVKLFRFNKKLTSYESFSYKEAFMAGTYYFLGDDKLLNITKSTAYIYKIIEDKSQIVFKKNGYSTGSYYICEKVEQLTENCTINITLGAA